MSIVKSIEGTTHMENTEISWEMDREGSFIDPRAETEFAKWVRKNAPGDIKPLNDFGDTNAIQT